jgi:hypothetical protein
MTEHSAYQVKLGKDNAVGEKIGACRQVTK